MPENVSTTKDYFKKLYVDDTTKAAKPFMEERIRCPHCNCNQPVSEKIKETGWSFCDNCFRPFVIVT